MKEVSACKPDHRLTTVEITLTYYTLFIQASVVDIFATQWQTFGFQVSIRIWCPTPGRIVLGLSCSRSLLSQHIVRGVLCFNKRVTL